MIALGAATLAGQVVAGPPSDQVATEIGPPTLDPSEALTRITFGSSIQQDRPLPIWSAVAATQPQLLMLIGDNIYGDTQDMTVLRAKYDRMLSNPGLAPILATTPLLTIWDDHDFGVNDGGDDFPKRVESQAVFNDVFRVPADSPRRSRPGLYDAVTVGPKGKRTQIILLDTRYFRSPLVKWPQDEPHPGGPYRPSDDPGKTFLGDDQWVWLADVLKQPADLRLVVSSIQVVPTEHNWEYWQNFSAGADPPSGSDRRHRGRGRDLPLRGSPPGGDQPPAGERLADRLPALRRDQFLVQSERRWDRRRTEPVSDRKEFPSTQLWHDRHRLGRGRAIRHAVRP